MRKLMRIIGKLVAYACAIAAVLGVCCLDGIPEAYLSEYIMLMLGVLGGCVAGVWLYFEADNWA